MDDTQDFFRRPFVISDWLELGDRLGPSLRQDLVAVFEHQEAKLGASRETLRRTQEMMSEGAALLEGLRTLRGNPALQATDIGRLDAVIHTVEETQKVIASHYGRLAREWLHSAGPLDGPHVPDED